jgi:hypothetical protein
VQRHFDINAHVSSRTYQPTVESSQEKQLDKLIKTPEYEAVKSWAEKYAAGEKKDPTEGATHYIAHAKAMYSLYLANPKKYPLKSWGSWSGFNKKTMDYNNKLHQDKSHAFLAPDPVGRFSIGRLEDIVDYKQGGFSLDTPMEAYMEMMRYTLPEESGH